MLSASFFLSVNEFLKTKTCKSEKGKIRTCKIANCNKKNYEVFSKSKKSETLRKNTEKAEIMNLANCATLIFGAVLRIVDRFLQKKKAEKNPYFT